MQKSQIRLKNISIVIPITICNAEVDVEGAGGDECAVVDEVQAGVQAMGSGCENGEYYAAIWKNHFWI